MLPSGTERVENLLVYQLLNLSINNKIYYKVDLIKKSTTDIEHFM